MEVPKENWKVANMSPTLQFLWAYDIHFVNCAQLIMVLVLIILLPTSLLPNYWNNPE